MDAKDLRVFQAVAQNNSVTKAAEQLNYVQSNVTNRINRLEAELQTSLFYRHARGMTLTPSGKILLEYAKKILHLFSEAYNALQDPFPKGPLTLGATESTAAVRIPPILSTYHQRYPDVELFLTTGTTEELIEQVLDYRLDGAFVVGPVDHPDILQKPLIKEELVLITSMCEESMKSLKDLQNKTILVFDSGCSYRAKLEQWLREEGILPIKKMEFNTLDGLIGCVKAGLGIALVSKSVADDLETAGLIRSHPIPQKYSQAIIVFIQRKDVLKTSALEHFLNLVDEYQAI